MKIGKALILPLIVSMLLGTAMLIPVGAQSTTIGVEPDSILDTGLVPGSTFTVEIMIRDVEDLVGFEFKLAYNTAVLTATDVVFGGIFTNYLEFFELIVDAEGWLYYAVAEWTLPVPQPFTGDGCAAVIHFTVDSVGDSALDLYDTKLGAPPDPQDPTTPVPIAHSALDGYLNNIPPPSVTLARRKAWPEHPAYETLWDEDSSNDLFAIVTNDGTEDTYVKVVFEVTFGGIPLGEFETQTVALAAGALYGDDKDNRLKTAFVPPFMGKYYVSAQCWADTNLDTVPDTPMGLVKTFSFKVAPEFF